MIKTDETVFSERFTESEMTKSSEVGESLVRPTETHRSEAADSGSKSPNVRGTGEFSGAVPRSCWGPVPILDAV